MDFLIELLMELVFDGMVEVTESKRVSKWIRYPIAGLLILLFVLVFALMGLVVILCLREGGARNICFGVFYAGAGCDFDRLFYRKVLPGMESAQNG